MYKISLLVNALRRVKCNLWCHKAQCRAFSLLLLQPNSTFVVTISSARHVCNTTYLAEAIRTLRWADACPIATLPQSEPDKLISEISMTFFLSLSAGGDTHCLGALSNARIYKPITVSEKACSYSISYVAIFRMHQIHCGVAPSCDGLLRSFLS